MPETGQCGSALLPISARLAHALRHADGIALSQGAHKIDWQELRRRVTALDNALSSAGIGPGGVVAVPGRNSITAASSCIALVATQRCAALVNPFQPMPAVLAAARGTKAVAVVVDEAELDTALITRDDMVFVVRQDGQVVRHGDGAAGNRVVAGDDIRLIMSTSGTTGDPKRIAISSATLTQATDEILAFHAGFGDSVRSDGKWPPLIQYSPLAHIGGTLTLLRGASQGRQVELLQKFDPHQWTELISDFRPFTVGLPPAMMRMLLDTSIDPSALSSLVSVWSGSAPVKTETMQAFTARFGLPVLGNYGATEFCGAVATWSLDDHRLHGVSKMGAAGRILPSVASARVREQGTGKILPPGETGILEMQVHRIGTEWLGTTDLAHIDEDGFLYLHGRADDVIIRGGFKLAPDLIARALREHPAIRDAAVVGIADARLGQVPVAAVEPVPGFTEPADQEIIAFLRQALPTYFIPVAIRRVAQLPRTPAMKLDRRAIRALFD